MNSLGAWIRVGGLLAVIGPAGALVDAVLKGRSRTRSGASPLLLGVTVLSAVGVAVLLWAVWMAAASLGYSDAPNGMPADLPGKMAGAVAVPAGFVVLLGVLLRRRPVASRLVAAMPMLAMMLFAGVVLVLSVVPY